LTLSQLTDLVQISNDVYKAKKKIDFLNNKSKRKKKWRQVIKIMTFLSGIGYFSYFEAQVTQNPR